MAATDDEILIGEGVALSTGSASVLLRMLSGIIDLLVYGLAAVGVIMTVSAALVGVNEAATRAAVIAATVIMLVLVPAAVETLTRGWSLGRLAVGLRVVRDDSGPISFRHAFARSMLGLLEIFGSLGMVAVSASMFSARGKRLGDMLAGTYAMRVRGQRRALPPVEMPPHLAEWASTADVRRLPDGLALTCRMFLSRAPGLHVDSRARLGRDLAGRLEAYIAPAAPPGTHPEYLIAAVLATRRDREREIMLRQQSRANRESERLGALPYDVPDVAN